MCLIYTSRNILTLFVLGFVWLQGYGALKFGPFKSYVFRVGACKTLTYKAIKNPTVLVDMEVYNTTTKKFLLRGNLNVTSDTRNIMIRVKSFAWDNGKWKINYLMNNLPCHGLFLPVVMTFFGIAFNRKECVMPKALNHFENINIDEIRHSVSSVAEYGRTLVRAEMYTRDMHTITCWEFEGEVVPDST